MLPDKVAAVAADAAIAVAAAAAVAAAQGRRSFCTSEPLFVDGTSYLLTGVSRVEESEGTALQAADPKVSTNTPADDEWQGTALEQWRYLRLLSGHWSPWTVTIVALSRQNLPPAAWKEFSYCSSLKHVHLEDCGISTADFCSNLPNLRRLLLPHNHLRSLHGLKNLPRLEELCIKGNPIRSFSGLSPLSGFSSLRRLDLQAFDGSEGAPVCKKRGYEDAVLALLPRKTAGEGWAVSQTASPRGPKSCSTRLDILDGKRLHLRPLTCAAMEAIEAAEDALAATRRFRAGVHSVLQSATRRLTTQSSTHKENLLCSSTQPSMSSADSQQFQPRKLLPEGLNPAEACQAVRELLARQVQEALIEAQQLMQQARLASLAAKRGSALAVNPLPAQEVA
ncbi:hypothetical protein Efla_005903 [Eimeria flavescens]